MKKRFIALLAVCISVVLILVLIRICINNKVVLSTENFEIKQKNLDYYIELEKDKYVDNYTQKYGVYYLEAVGLEPQKSLKKQDSCYGVTWYEYFREKAVEDLKTKLLYCEAAIKQGFSPHPLRNSSGSASKYIRMIEDFSAFYLDNFKKSITISEKEKEDYYKNNRSLFDCVDYDCIVVNYSSDATSENSDLINRIINSIEKIGYEKTLKKLNLKNNSLIEIKSEKDYRYNDTTQLGEWAFDVNRKDGDVIGFEGRGIYSIYHIKKTAHPIDYKVKKIQKISLKTVGENDKLYQLNEIKNKLDENNTDENLYSQADTLNLDVAEIKAKKEDLSLNLEDWLYDSNRKIGDYTILEDELSTSFVRYCGESESYYEIHLADCIYESIIRDNLKELEESITITSNIG